MVILPSQIDSVDCSVLEQAFALSETEDLPKYLELCRHDLAQLWQCGNLFAITTVHNTKSGRAIRIEAMAGEYDKALVDEIEAFGKQVGCNKIFFVGRKGWMKRVPDYTLKTVTLEKGL